MPRMTNTFMLAQQGSKEIIASVKKALLRQLWRGQVDIVSGKFVFSVTEAT